MPLSPRVEEPNTEVKKLIYVCTWTTVSSSVNALCISLYLNLYMYRWIEISLWLWYNYGYDVAIQHIMEDVVYEIMLTSAFFCVSSSTYCNNHLLALWPKLKKWWSPLTAGTFLADKTSAVHTGDTVAEDPSEGQNFIALLRCFLRCLLSLRIVLTWGDNMFGGDTTFIRNGRCNRHLGVFQVVLVFLCAPLSPCPKESLLFRMILDRKWFFILRTFSDQRSGDFSIRLLFWGSMPVQNFKVADKVTPVDVVDGTEAKLVELLEQLQAVTISEHDFVSVITYC